MCKKIKMYLKAKEKNLDMSIKKSSYFQNNTLLKENSDN